MFRITSGTLASDSTIRNVSNDSAARVGAVGLMQGKTQETVSEIKAGDLGSVAKLKDTRTGDTLAAKGTSWRFAPW